MASLHGTSALCQGPCQALSVRFPTNYHTSSEVDAILIPLFLQRRKLSCREVRPLSQDHTAS